MSCRKIGAFSPGEKVNPIYHNSLRKDIFCRLKENQLFSYLEFGGNRCRAACFFAPDDYQYYLNHLADACRDEGVQLHAYVLMTNHVHLLMTPENGDGPSRVMKRLGQRYVQYINRIYHRSGTLWEGRFRSCLVREEAYLLGCYRYIELNPVRAAMVAHPADYPWSSYRANAQGESNVLIAPHPVFLALGSDDVQRQSAYRELFRERLDSGLVDEIRASTKGGYVLGGERFQKEVAVTIGRRTWRGRAGRPVTLREGG